MQAETKEVSVLQDLGAGLTGILSPVSICMGLTCVLVRLLNPDGNSGSNALRFASIAYDEDPTDSDSKKFEGAFLNALVYVLIVTVMTFAIVLLFKYGCQRIVWAWMALGIFDIFFAITGLIGIEVLQALNIHVDILSFCFMLFNFAVVGTVGVLFVPIPLLLKQSYLVWVGVISAYIFTWIPEWTAWMIICAMALYDIVAVLCPGGPLKLLLEEAMKREEALPGLLYEARPSKGPYQGPDVWVRRDRNGGQGGADAQGSNAEDDALISRAAAAAATDPEQQQQQQQQQQGAESCPTPAGSPPRSLAASAAAAATAAGRGAAAAAAAGSAPAGGRQRRWGGASSSEQAGVELAGKGAEPHGGSREPGQLSLTVEDSSESWHHGQLPHKSPQQQPMHTQQLEQPSGTSRLGVATDEELQAAEEGQRLLLAQGRRGSGDGMGPRGRGGDAAGLGGPSSDSQGEEEGGLEDLDAIKLGLGDFVFYSLLVGRAAMYDSMTVFAAYIGIIAGLGLTLIFLAISQHALPALPFSIAMGVVFYFFTRLVLEPFLVPMAMQLQFY